MSVLSKPYFHDEAKAFKYLEGILWPEGPVCPHCGTLSVKHYDLSKTRVGLHKCAEKACRKQFTVKVGTVFEQAHIPLNKMLQAVYLMCSSKKGISAHQLHRVLEITYKSAWFLAHRIREAMRDDKLGPIGGAGLTIEADETYLNRSPKTKNRATLKRDKEEILSLVERGGKIRSVYLDEKNVRQALYEHLNFESRLVTDKAQHFKNMLPDGQHESVDHSKYEWARGDVHINTLEGFFSIFKRGLIGTYQHVDKKYLHRYLSEFDFRYNYRAKLGFEDGMRAEKALFGMVGKRLRYRSEACA
jgi:transposase-like protein